MNRILNASSHLGQLLKGAAALFTALCVTACGPGTGGTGMSSSAILGTYVSAVTSGSPASTPSTGAVPGIALAASPDANFVVTFEAERVTLNNACLVFSSQGARIESDGQLQIDGLFRINAPGINPASAVALPATLVARVDGTGLQVTLRTPAGALLASFGTSAQLPAGSNPAPAGACVAKAG
jgi:hypothetical protein